MPDEIQRRNEWPIETLGRWRAEPENNLPAGFPMQTEPWEERPENWETEIYYPASAPNVLSKEEARAIIAVADSEDYDWEVLDPLLANLSAWAGGQS